MNNNNKNDTTARDAAFFILRKIYKDKAYSNIEVGNSLDTFGLSKEDKSFVKSICFGVLERQLMLDRIIMAFVSKKPDPDTLLFLRMGLQQIQFMSVPANAACNETVSAAKKVLDNSRAGFINAVLRNICRNEQKVNEIIEKAPEHVRYSVDESIYNLLKEQYKEQTDKILDSFFNPNKLVLRINTLKATKEQVLKELQDIGALVNEISETALEVVKCAGAALKGLESGRYFVQGMGSQKAVSMLDARQDQTVIDVCACPGGKSFGVAIDMNNTGKVLSFDIHANKLSLIKSGAKRLGIKIITAEEQDSRIVNESLLDTADRVICDVPCSGLGVISSKPEIRYKTVGEFEGLYKTQRSIIETASEYLKKGGIMVYSTCTLNKKENEQIVHGFLSANNGFELLEEHTFLPCDDAGEGFYAAKIIKKTTANNI